MNKTLALLGVMLMLVSGGAYAQVLGGCGTDEALEPVSAPAPGEMTRVPLPGEQAPNFELIAVVGDEITNIRLSDYDGMWRVVCFYPADFTFV